MSTTKPIDLCAVMPVYNEECAIESVVREWITELRGLRIAFTLLVINDGSKDGTKTILDELAASIPEMTVMHRTNVGHGNSCIFGYRWAVEEKAQWIFQIDSDGQCAPAYFAEFWRTRTDCPIIFGFRKWRDDGLGRLIVSRVLSLVILSTTGFWIRDSNVPYRLMRSDILKMALAQFPEQTMLSNVLVSYVLRQRRPIKWISMRFRKRVGGASFLRWTTLPRITQELFCELRRLRPARHRGPSEPIGAQLEPTEPKSANSTAGVT